MLQIPQSLPVSVSLAPAIALAEGGVGEPSAGAPAVAKADAAGFAALLASLDQPMPTGRTGAAVGKSPAGGNGLPVADGSALPDEGDATGSPDDAIDPALVAQIATIVLPDAPVPGTPATTLPAEGRSMRMPGQVADAADAATAQFAAQIVPAATDGKPGTEIPALRAAARTDSNARAARPNGAARPNAGGAVPVVPAAPGSAPDRLKTSPVHMAAPVGTPGLPPMAAMLRASSAHVAANPASATASPVASPLVAASPVAASPVTSSLVASAPLLSAPVALAPAALADSPAALATLAPAIPAASASVVAIHTAGAGEAIGQSGPALSLPAGTTSAQVHALADLVAPAVPAPSQPATRPATLAASATFVLPATALASAVPEPAIAPAVSQGAPTPEQAVPASVVRSAAVAPASLRVADPVIAAETADVDGQLAVSRPDAEVPLARRPSAIFDVMPAAPTSATAILHQAVPQGTAPLAAAAAEGAQTQPDLNAVIDRLVEARATARSGDMRLAVAHDDFGPVGIRFDATAGAGLAVSLTSADADFAPAVHAALVTAAAERDAIPRDGNPRDPAQREAAQRDQGARHDGAPGSGQQQSTGASGQGSDQHRQSGGRTRPFDGTGRRAADTRGQTDTTRSDASGLYA